MKVISKPKIIHFIWWIPHYRVPIFKLLSKNKRFDFEVCAGDSNEIYGGAKVASGHEAVDINGLNWRRIKSRRIKGPFFSDFEWQGEAVRIALKENVDVVISLGYQSLSNILIRIICKIRGIPLIEWTQGVRCEEKCLRWFTRKLYYKWAKAFLLYGEFARDFFESHGFKKESLFVVHNSLDHSSQVRIRDGITQEKIVEFKEKLGIKEGERLLVHSGRLESQKKLDVLVMALSELKKRGKKIKLVLIGDGREKENLVNYAKEKNVSDEIIFYGECYQENIIGLIFSSSDLCVAPGAVGLIAMHCMVYGTPLLTCENQKGLHGPEVGTVIEGETGGFFEEDNIEDLVCKLESMLYPESCKCSMASECMEMIDKYYTPEYQEKVIIQAINYVLPPEKQIVVSD